MLTSLKKMYKNLMKDGWTLNDIDEMDIHFFFDLFSEDTEQIYYIDQVM